MNEYNTKVKKIKKFSKGSISISLEKPKELNFKAGQFMMIHCNGKEKPFSIGSHPSEKTLDFLIKVHQNGKITPKLCNLKKGSPLKISGPYGTFIVKSTLDKEIFFIASGTGISPFRAMVKEALKNNSDKKITLIFGFRNDFYYKKEFEKLEQEYSNFNLIPSCSAPKKTWKGKTGRVTEHIKEIIKSPDYKEVYICGMPEMVKTVKTMLIDEIGLKTEQVHVEEW